MSLHLRDVSRGTPRDTGMGIKLAFIRKLIAAKLLIRSCLLENTVFLATLGDHRSKIKTSFDPFIYCANPFHFFLRGSRPLPRVSERNKNRCNSRDFIHCFGEKLDSISCYVLRLLCQDLLILDLVENKCSFCVEL